jgi:UDP-N-acetylmuramate dehydrogenase
MIEQNVNLKPHNTFGLSCKAAKFSNFSNIEELKALLSNRKNTDDPMLVLGGGSNLLLTKDFDGLVLKNEIQGIEIISENEEFTLVKAGAGEVWHQFVLFAIDNNLGGIENMSLIPGSVGAAPMQNIGAYGVEIKDVFHELEALNLSTLEIEKFQNQDCQFGYRESVFKHAQKGKYIIVNVTLKLERKHHLNTSYGAIEQELEEMEVTQPTIRDVSNAVIAIRKRKLPDPAEIGNSGSFFKNPVINAEKFKVLKAAHPNIAHYPIDENHIKIAAGWLIDQAGWKGKTLGSYGVHKNQALVLVNYGGAKGQDIYQLSEDIKQDIISKFGIELEREVNVI